jgi:hypothetical protein
MINIIPSILALLEKEWKVKNVILMAQQEESQTNSERESNV